ncbi:hypothetical protein [Stenotrophomonas pavanii]|uniref:hypothetical protein n=1 Tax=Stenotrophomonas pavanii TaxID=487698 RepID=UPI0039C63F76
MIKSTPLHPLAFSDEESHLAWKTVFKGKFVYTGCGIGLPNRIDIGFPNEVRATKRILEAHLAHVPLAQFHEIFVRDETAALISVHHFLSQAAEKDAVFFLCTNARVSAAIIHALNVDDQAR